MKLIELLVKVLPGKGGWPDRATGCVQDNNGFAWFFRNGKPKFISPCWSSEEHQNAFDWEGSVFLREAADDNSHAIISREQYESALAALTETAPQQVESLAWDGQGLPPAGCECEHCPGGTTQNDWEIVTVLGISERPGGVFTDYWLRKEDGSSYVIGNPYRFRPIRTKAERRRDYAVGALERAWEEVTNRPAAQFEVIYDAIAAGKIPGVKLED